MRSRKRLYRRRRRNGERPSWKLLHNCTEENMMCVNTVGSFECACEEGFTYDPHTHVCVGKCMMKRVLLLLSL